MNIGHFLYDYLVMKGMSETSAKYLNMLVLLASLLVISFLVHFIIRKIIMELFTKFAAKTRSNFDDLLVKNKAPRNIAQIIPLIVVLELVPIVFIDFTFFAGIVKKGLQVFAIVLILWIVRSLLNTLKDYFKTLSSLKDKPIDSYIQVIMILAWVFGILSAFAIITGIEFIKFITTIGAASAVIILVFRDTILGFVASIQVSINDMVRIGDWITFEKYGADGDVIEINLSTVKVQNFDKTITTIPTYALISDSFKNWRGMENSDGRRIKRSLNIKLNSISYLTKEEVFKLKKIHSIASYLETRQSDIEDYNTNHNINKELLLNGKNLTNIGVFRKYIETYIENHSGTNKEMMIMVRQLAPGTQGIPLEIYAFSNDKRWKNYEYIMADIFDHIIAAVPYFSLEIFEFPSNASFMNTN
ncbi:miniconductance mechanosensitive channel [Polaribacter sp. Hel1_33_78]|jgi:miniconductance mechanosensitive channel|uniref:mechanosensitive ion channel family protein n=1 Tax=unclassified Polaribacter TaxID=196858 RepID=UPI00052DD3DE|nr:MULTISPECIES: mechanosensitive ion channel domain-containing protein [unclassified Polaribacter]MBT4414508.1 mechanosensitive ion channel [Polaribacter sp.]KGL60970.1 small-conductance mechanosensitive channel [Polaribacter sp. Hel1_33_49]MBT7816847.1 mechanosensitive ion channel [Polaribacter sp.]PKV64745.1 miniconductance mechanosensitive channel [Polaribacter sp. Hel1_33_96]SDU06681.1 miniconductance mechanosensitive channel [Polaribacter sp. Hel1_33_78]